MDNQKKQEFIINILYWAIIVVLVYFFFKYVFGYISPFVIAFVIAALLNKPSVALAKKLKLPKKVISVIVVLVFYGTVGALMSLLGVKIFGWVINFVMGLPQTYAITIEPFLHSVFSSIETSFYAIDPEAVEGVSTIFYQFSQGLNEMITNLSLQAVSFVSLRATSVPKMVVKIVISIISSFYFAADYDNISTFLNNQIPHKWRDILFGIKEFVLKKLLFFGKSYFTIMMITFVELSLGLTILRVENAIPIALGIAVFDIIPVLGTGGIMIPWALVRLLQGDLRLAVGLMIVYLIITVIRNIIEPRIVGSQIGLHPVLTLISMFIGMSLFGIVGLFAAPICMSLFKYLKDEKIVELYK